MSAYIKILRDALNNIVYPQTKTSAIYNNDNINLDTILNNMCKKSSSINTTLLASNWSNKLYTVSNNNIENADQLIELLPSATITQEQFEALQSANIIHNSQSIGSITMRAIGDVPTIDIPIILIIRRDIDANS